jgi:hypothetical protein
MSQSKLVTESVYSDGHHSEINRMIAVCIDEGSAAYVFDWALHNMFDPKTDMVNTNTFPLRS